MRAPSGLFPGAGPPRPTYREPHPVRGIAVATGLGASSLWFLLFGLLAVSASVRSYAWYTILAGLAAWGTALVLARHGDRGVAVGVATGAGVAWAAAALVVAITWAATGDWPLW